MACFLLWPLRFTFERPPLDGTFGLMFDVLMGFDKPFNQAPSLHITLLVIIWAMFANHTRGLFWRGLLHGWMGLIGISVLDSTGSTTSSICSPGRWPASSFMARCCCRAIRR